MAKKRFVRVGAHVNFDDKGGTIGTMAYAATGETTTTEPFLFYTGGGNGFKIDAVHDNAAAAGNGLQLAPGLRHQPDASSSRSVTQPASRLSGERRSGQERSHVVAWDQSPILPLFLAGWAQPRESESWKTSKGRSRPMASGQAGAPVRVAAPLRRR